MPQPSQIPPNPEIAVAAANQGVTQSLPNVTQADPAAPPPTPDPPAVPEGPTAAEVQSKDDFWDRFTKAPDDVMIPPTEDLQGQPLAPVVEAQPPVPSEPPAQQVQPLAPEPVPQALPPAQFEPTVQQPVAPAPLPPAAPEVLQPEADQAALVGAAVDHLAKTQYVLNDSDAELLISEPEKVMPRLAAQLHVNLAQQMGQMVANLLPQYVTPIIEQHSKAAQAESDFFGRYPGLQNPQFREVVTQSLQLSRQMNPQANRDQVMQMAATTAAQTLQMAGHNIAGATNGQQPPQQAVAPVAPAQQQNLPPYAPAAQQPAGNVLAPSDPLADNPWAQLVADTADWP